MESLLKQIEEYKKEIGSFSAGSDKEVEDFRIKYLGTKGIVKAIMGEMKNVPAEQKKEFGQILNEFKHFTETRFEELKNGTTGPELHINKHRPYPSGRSGTNGRPASHYPDEKQDDFYFSAPGLCCSRRSGN